ncbi:IdeS/Mac family cysteine endopeptidase [Weeksellaceae bacterium TAE3-ERU29]|nr:IdeS/Mac family cysteine endopeptidase [Weeksellaceae bacterium TAE3-ERU29]
MQNYIFKILVSMMLHDFRKIKLTKVALLLSIIFFVLSACSKEDIEENKKEEPKKEEVKDDKQAEEKEEYLSFSVSGIGEIEDNVSIGVYCPSATERYKQFKITKKEKEWLPKVTKNDLKSGKIMFYYPVESSMNSENCVLNMSLNQTQDIDYEKSKFYFAQSDLGENKKEINVSFKEIMHELDLNIKNEEIPTDLKVSLKCVPKATISLVTEKITIENIEKGEAIFHKKEEGKYSLIMIPQGDLEGIDFLWNEGKSKMHYEFQNKSVFEKGEKTTLEITLKDENKVNIEEPPSTGIIDSNFKNKRMWVYGVNSPTYPEDESQVPTYDYGDNSVKGEWVKDSDNLGELRWEKGAGWFDVNKAKSKRKYTYSDDRLCWAATASNMVHWWLKHNKDYINKYYEKFSTEKKIPDTEYDIPENYSEIFELFTESFMDKSGWPTDGAEWFISGSGYNLAPPRNYDKPTFPGYFSKVFKGEKLTEDVRWPSKEKFNNVVKEAYKNKRALGFVVFLGGYGNHAMTIWGTEFDENGDVSYIYYCDNNSQEEMNKVGICMRRKVIYEDNKTYYVPRDNEKYKNQILSIVTLDLGTEIWKQKLNLK